MQISFHQFILTGVAALLVGLAWTDGQTVSVSASPLRRRQDSNATCQKTGVAIL